MLFVAFVIAASLMGTLAWETEKNRQEEIMLPMRDGVKLHSKFINSSSSTSIKTCI